MPATTADKKTPLELLEAQNAIAIAQAAGADQYAVDTLGKAKAYLAQGQNYLKQKQNITPIGAVARAATQAAEDARLLTLQKKQEEQTAAEKQRAMDRIQQAQSQAESEVRASRCSPAGRATPERATRTRRARAPGRGAGTVRSGAGRATGSAGSGRGPAAITAV